MTLIMKFGGTSVGSAEAIRRTAALVAHFRAQWPRLVVVASAMSGVTDWLLQGARTAADGDGATYLVLAQRIIETHEQTLAELLGDDAGRAREEIGSFVERYIELCRAVFILGELTPRALDTMSGMGEQMSVRLLAAYLRQQGIAAEAVDATELIVTDDNYGSATPLMAETVATASTRLGPLLEASRVAVVTGFIGATAGGVTTTLGRGGSDYSAAILGQALSADAVWIWTDVDGVMTADPRLVPGARSIPTLSQREISELAFFGAKVLHPKSIRPVVENNIPLRIKNTFHPDHPGTLIVEDDNSRHGALKAVTAIKELSLVTIEGKGMIGVPGIAARAFGAVARAKVSVLLISQASSEQSICFAAPSLAVAGVVAGLEAEFAIELQRRDIDRIWALQPVAIVTVVGAGMRGTPGIAGRIFSALGRQGVNIVAIAQGSSECSISLVVLEEDTASAVNYIHELIVEPERD
jgi:aspartate kinase